MADTSPPFDLVESERAALAHFQAGRLLEAQTAFQGIASAVPDNATAWEYLGQIALQMGQVPQAEACFQRLVMVRPEFAEAHRHLGVALATQGKWEAALAEFLRAVEIDPDYADGHIGVGNAYFEQQRYEEAGACYRRVLQIKPEYAKAHSNLGMVLQKLGRLDDALACYQQAIAHDPKFVDAYKNLASVYQELGRMDKAIEYADTALQLQPGSVLLQGYFAPLYLLSGNLERGLAFYECRFSGADKSLAALWQRNLARFHGKPRWQGEALQGKRLLIWREQGLGDGIMMARYLPLLKARGAGEVIVTCWPELTSLMRTLPAVDQVVDDREHPILQGFDCHCPIMSLPYLFHTRLDTVANEVPYFTVPSVLQEKWAERLAGLPGMKVGLAWAGSRTQAKDNLRSIAFEALVPLLAIPGVQFISLQKNETAHHPALKDWMAECNDFLDTAALVRQLDLVISVDTAVAHLAGALAKPVWLFNRYESEWRWMLNRDDSPWYPSMRIFRQAALNDWDGVIARVAVELRALSTR